MNGTIQELDCGPRTSEPPHTHQALLSHQYHCGGFLWESGFSQPACPPSGICGFLTFGAAVNPDVLLSYPSEDVAVAVARAFIILSVLTSYPILHFCGR